MLNTEAIACIDSGTWQSTSAPWWVIAWKSPIPKHYISIYIWVNLCLPLLLNPRTEHAFKWQKISYLLLTDLFWKPEVANRPSMTCPLCKLVTWEMCVVMPSYPRIMVSRPADIWVIQRVPSNSGRHESCRSSKNLSWSPPLRMQRLLPHGILNH